MTIHVSWMVMKFHDRLQYTEASEEYKTMKLHGLSKPSISSAEFSCRGDHDTPWFAKLNTSTLNLRDIPLRGRKL